MGSHSLDSVTFWLQQWHTGDDRALAELTRLVYDDLRRLAAHYLQDERADHTLQATAVVHELYLRIGSMRDIDWKNRAQFIAVASQAMRRILIDHARKRRALKRAAEENPTLSEPSVTPDIDVLAVDMALDRLAAIYPRHARVVELRFFGGLELPEIAELLETSLRTVERDWRLARAWLHNEFAATVS